MSKQDVSLEKLLETGAHFGHQTKRWNPKMKDYVYGVREGVSIFDLIKTRKAIEEALEFISKAKKEGKNILLLGTKKQVKDHVAKIGQETGVFYINERWLGGTFTNFDQIKTSVRTLKSLKEDLAAGKFKNHTKKERLLIQRRIEKLERTVGGLKGMDKIPDVMIVVDTKRERAAVLEAQKSGVTLVGIVDTNGDPTDSTYPIPMNDDSPQALEYIMELIQNSLGGSTKKSEEEKESKPKAKAKKADKVKKTKAEK